MRVYRFCFAGRWPFGFWAVCTLKKTAAGRLFGFSAAQKRHRILASVSRPTSERLRRETLCLRTCVPLGYLLLGTRAVNSLSTLCAGGGTHGRNIFFPEILFGRREPPDVSPRARRGGPYRFSIFTADIFRRACKVATRFVRT